MSRTDPFLITGPALISFSGGRTSAYMLWRILQSHGGTLPDDVVVAFANTGKEREETLRFVHECGARWGVRIHWVEWRDTPAGFEEVGFNSASRNGEPFAALIAKKGALPNGTQRWCTQWLKVKPIFAFMRAAGLGEPGDYCEAIGLRNDEAHRILRGLDRAEKDGRRLCYPLGNAGVSKRDVLAFWWGRDRVYETRTLPQGFDLDLPPLWGNCDFCFAMGVGIRRERARQVPAVTAWWQDQEAATGRTFSMRESVAEIVQQAAASDQTVDLFADFDDAECGTWCLTDEVAA
jgi:hypothetical protein